jgi:copper chaperone CopZ
MIRRAVPFAAALVAAVLCGSALAAERTARIGVDGMVCAFCAQGIEKKLKARAEVDRIFVSLENKVVAVGFKDGRSLGDDELGRLIVDSGYRVVRIDRVEQTVDEIRASVARR